MKTMGLDLSLAETGIAVMEDGKSIDRSAIKTAAKGTARLILIADEVLRQVELYNPVCIAIEAVAYGSYSAVDIAELHGAVRSILYRNGYNELFHVAPSTLKKFATTHGHAKKSDIKLELKTRWDIEERNDNKADAYILARMASVHRGFIEAENKEQREAVAKARETTEKKEGRMARERSTKKRKTDG